MNFALPRERNIAFTSVLPFYPHPVEKRRSILPTGSRIIALFRLYLRGFLLSRIASIFSFVFDSALSTQHSALCLKRNPVSC